MDIKITWRFVFVLLFCFTNISYSYADVPPESAVSDMLTMLRAKGTPLSLLDYVDWHTAYQRLDADNLPKGLVKEVKSPQDYRRQVKRILENPERFANTQAKSIIRDLRPKDRAIANHLLPLLPQIIESEVEKFRQKQRKTKYKVGKAKIAENLASVPIESEFEGEKRNHTVSLIKNGNRWYLTSPKSQIFFGTMVDHIGALLAALRKSKLPQLAK